MRTGTLDIKVGGVDIRLAVSDDILLGACEDTYRLFITDGTAAPTHRVLVTASDSRQEAKERDFIIGRERGNKGYFIIAPYFRGQSSPDFSEGTLEILFAPNVEYMERAVENYVRWALANILLTSGRGLLLHASASVLKGQAHVFLGPHGSGKSTAALLSTNGFMIADDVLPIILERGGVTAAAMPAVGKFGQNSESASCYPLGNFYWINKSGKNSLDKLGAAAGTGLLMASAPFIKETENYHAKLFETAAGIIDRVALYNLYFRKEERFLDAALKNAAGEDKR